MQCMNQAYVINGLYVYNYKTRQLGIYLRSVYFVTTTFYHLAVNQDIDTLMTMPHSNQYSNYIVPWFPKPEVNLHMIFSSSVQCGNK